MKRILGFILASLLLVGCGSNTGTTGGTTAPQEEKVELVVFAAASMTKTMEQIKEKYIAENPNVDIVYTFDSSGTLKTQIEEGADCDIFISAAQRQMNLLDIASEANTDKLDFVESDTHINLLKNRVTLVVKEGNTKEITSFEDLNTDKVETIALGNSDVPVGQYSEEILKNMGIWDAIQPKVTFGSNVKEVTTWVSESSVDTGIIYATDAFSAGLEIVAYPPEGTLANEVVYPAAVLKKTTNKDEAVKFLYYLQGDTAKEIFESVGFVMAD